MPKSEIATLDTFFELIANVPVDEILVNGQPWGALEEMILGHNHHHLYHIDSHFIALIFTQQR
jgi:hypothetical protein